MIDATPQIVAHDGCAHVSGELTIYRVSELAQELLALWREHPTERIDLSGVEECDSAGLQLLLALRKFNLSQQRKLEIVRMSVAVESVLQLCQLSSGLEAHVDGDAHARSISS